MDLFELTRVLVDIESVTNNEGSIGEFLLRHLSSLAQRYTTDEWSPWKSKDSASTFSQAGELSTHMDTVPPFFPCCEDQEFLWGRGACDAKGIIAAMIHAAVRLLSDGDSGFGLLFLVGEERNSAGAPAAAKIPCGSQYLINGEPTESKIALGAKGALRFELAARGRSAPSGYPDQGCSAIEAMPDALQDMRRIPPIEDALLGKSTVNIGTVSGGRAANVIADEAHAEVMFRLVGYPSPIRKAMKEAVAGRIEAREVPYTPARQFGRFDGLPTTVVALTTDIPALEQTWGAPFLFGPGSIHLAHTAEERVSKRELQYSVEIYVRMVKQLLRSAKPEGCVQ